MKFWTGKSYIILNNFTKPGLPNLVGLANRNNQAGLTNIPSGLGIPALVGTEMQFQPICSIPHQLDNIALIKNSIGT